MKVRIRYWYLPIIALVLLSLPAQSAEKHGTRILFDESYGRRLPESTTDVSLWWASSGWKVSQTRPVPKRAGKAIRISLARNETEAAQLVVRPAKTIASFVATATALTGPRHAVVPADKIDVLRVRYVNVERPTDPSSAKAPWPDPLPPFVKPIELAAGLNQPLWIRVHAPKGAPVGNYRGTIALRGEGYQADVPLLVHVYDFELPDRMTCETAFGFDPGTVYHYQKLATSEEKHQVLEKYWASLSAHHIAPYDPTPGVAPKAEWTKLRAEDAAKWPEAERAMRQASAVTPVFNWDAWDAEMQRMMDTYQFHSVRLGLPGMGGSEVNGFKRGSPERALAFKSYAYLFQEHLRQKGWLNVPYVYWFDEPLKTDYPFVLAGFKELKEAAPDIRRMLTNQPEPELFGGPNLWCPLTMKYHHETAEARRALGEHFWWYVCTVPKRPFCGLFIDHPGTDLRAWLWQTWKYDFEGILIWASNLWTTDTAYPDKPQNPYEDPMSWESGNGVQRGEKRPWGNGDGRFMYPPEAAAGANPPGPVLDGPVDTIRWEMLRDGIEDYEYLAILKRLIDARKSELSRHAIGRLQELLEVPTDITADLKNYTKDPAPIEHRRDKIARAIERLSRRM